MPYIGTGLDTVTTVVSTAAATVCPSAGGGSATYLVGVVNNSLTAQSATLTIYDNPSAPSGPVAASIGPLGISQVVTFPAPGIRLQTGATALASGVPVGGGIQVLTR